MWAVSYHVKPAIMSSARSSGTGKIRIIAGEWRGRKLPVAALEGLRPTGDRIRETLFNWLQGEIYGARCLDLFAGSGALGFEALSRGANHTDFVESQAKAATQIQDNIELLKARATAHICKAGDFLRSYDGPAFNLVFLDPPFAENLWEDTIKQLNNGKCLASDACIYLEAPVNTKILVPPEWELSKSRSTGNVSFSLFRINNS